METMKVELTEDEWNFICNAINIFQDLNTSLEDKLGNEIWTDDEYDVIESLKSKKFFDPDF